jgi:cyclic beta-1,2-glucan synthetase
VTEGYGILQPRVSVTMSSASGSLFARLYAGHTGVDPYTTAVSDTYQDLFGEGIFTGKGLYEVDAFMAALEGRVPENALLSHDLFEGLHARAALVSDVEVVDDYPSSVLAHARRLRRWVRGDWQILGWLFPVVPARGGLERNRLRLISRWKILDNLRRSLVAPSVLLLLAAAWTVLPGRPAAWTAAVLAALAFPAYPLLLQAIRGPLHQQPAGVFLKHLAEDLKTALAQALLTLTFLAYHAYDMLHAIVLTLVRMVVTQRRLLEWETAAAAAARAAFKPGAGGRRVFVAEMVASPATAALLVPLVLSSGRPGAASVAFPFLALWALAPLIAHWLSQPVRLRRLDLDHGERAYLRQVARKTWRWFETFVGPDDHWLPPDNYQEEPGPVVAHRTSPTNVGMGLLATLAAHDLGYIRTPELADRVEKALSIDGVHGAARGPPAQLVRQREPGPAPSALRLHGGQRQPVRRAPDPGRRDAAHRARRSGPGALAAAHGDAAALLLRSLRPLAKVDGARRAACESLEREAKAVQAILADEDVPPAEKLGELRRRAPAFRQAA